jgi:glycosyltransferase involved in cell wall biosynthesis
MRVDPTEMDRHYRRADWLFHVTRIDGSPRVVIEALARGLPVIGSRHPGVTVLDPEDRYILFSEPFDPDAVLDQLVSEKTNSADHEQRSVAGSSYVTENFSSDAVSDRYIDLYMSLLSERES